MNVQHLIEQLSRLDPEAKILVWDALNDCASEFVTLEPQRDGAILITNDTTSP